MRVVVERLERGALKTQTVLEVTRPAADLLGRLTEGVSRHVFGQWLALRLLEEGIVAQPGKRHTSSHAWLRSNPHSPQ